MVHLQIKLKALKIDLLDAFIVPYVLSSLLIKFSTIKIVYNILSDPWDENQSISKRVVEKENLRGKKRVRLSF